MAQLTFGEKLADKCAEILGSWRFIVFQSIILTLYILWNLFSEIPFDPYPFIFLNLVLSFQAAYSVPVIMMSQNRKEEIDRKRLISIYSMLESGDEKRKDDLEEMLERKLNRIERKIDSLEQKLEKRLTKSKQ